MSKFTFNNEIINIYSENEVVRYISEKQIIFVGEFQLKIAKTKTYGEMIELLKNNDLDIEVLGFKRMESLRYKVIKQYRLQGELSFQLTSRNITKNKSVEVVRESESETIKRLQKENENLRVERDILKKYITSLKKIANKKRLIFLIFEIAYRYRNRMAPSITIDMLCDELQISLQYYYRVISFVPSQDEINYLFEEALLTDFIKLAFDRTNKKLGYRQIYMLLMDYKDKFGIVNHKKVYRIMRQLGLKSTVRTRKNKYGTIEETKSDEVFENILDRNFNPEQPYTVFNTDITYLFYKGGKAYLSAIRDCCTGEIVASYISRSFDINLSIKVIDILSNKLNVCGAIVHSDRGSHYVAHDYIDKLKEIGAIQSMSRVGKCIDNAPIESWFGHFKDELEYSNIETIEELITIVNNYVIYYNHQRRIWSKKKMTPINYRNHLLAA